MHLIVIVVELKSGHRIVTLNNRRVYISTDEGMLEPGSATWLCSVPPAGSSVRGCIFDCGVVKETTLENGLR